MAKITDILRDMLNEKQADPKEILETEIQSVKDQLEEDGLEEAAKTELEEKLEILETKLSEEFPPKKKDDEEDEEDDEKVDEEFPPKKKDDEDEEDDEKVDEEFPKKKDDDEDEDMDEASLVPHVDAIKNLFKDQDLSEETLEKLGVLFTAAVSSLVNEKVKSLKTELAEAAKNELEEAINQIDERVDTYITYAAEEYLKENEIAVEQGIKSELVESFLVGMKDLFNEHYVDIPEEKVDIVAELGAKLEESEDKANVLIEENIANKLEINEFKKSAALAKLSEGLADTDKEKIVKLSEDIEYKDEESFTSSITTLKENYLFGNKETINEDLVVNDKEKDNKPLTEMDSYLKALKSPGFK